MYAEFNDLDKIATAINVIKEMGKAEFTRKEFDACKPHGSTTVDWLQGEHIITVVRKETFTKTIPLYSPKIVYVDKFGQQVCSEWEYNHDKTIRSLADRLGAKPKAVMTEEIKCERFYYGLVDAESIERKMAKLKDEAILAARKTVAKCEPKLKKAYAVLAVFGEIQ